MAVRRAVAALRTALIHHHHDSHLLICSAASVYGMLLLDVLLYSALLWYLDKVRMCWLVLCVAAGGWRATLRYTVVASHS